MAADIFIIGYDAGFCHLGYFVAKLPSLPSEKAIPIEFGVSDAPLPSQKQRKREGIPVATQNVLRVRRQARFLVEMHNQYRPSAYFVEFPHGGAKSSTAARGMGLATGLLAATLEAVAPEVPMVVFIPSTIKEAVSGSFKASKEAIAQQVIDYWPEIENWPGFKLSGKGKKTKSDATDAGAVLIAARDTDIYKALFARKP